MTFWKSETFKALQDAWYKRLKDIGFSDAEEVVGGELVLKVYNLGGKRCAARRRARESYYIALAYYINETKFEDDVERIVMEKHADGFGNTAIVIELEKLGKRRCRRTIYSIIKKFRLLWGIKTSLHIR